MSPSSSVHASCVAVGEAGVLVRGPSGSGKSAFSAGLMERAAAAGLFARLVADDRVRLEAAHGRLIASAPSEIAGLMERRGFGIVAVPHLPAVVLRLVVDIVDAPERMPDIEALGLLLEGVTLAGLTVARGHPEAPGLALARLKAVRDPADVSV